MRRVFVVYGTTGEYSDRTEWAVCAFDDEKKAKLFAVRANRWAKSLEAQRASMDYEERAAAEGACPFDPNFHMDYTGTDYTFGPVEIRDEVPAEAVFEREAKP